METDALTHTVPCPVSYRGIVVGQMMIFVENPTCVGVPKRFPSAWVELTPIAPEGRSAPSGSRGNQPRHSTPLAAVPFSQTLVVRDMGQTLLANPAVPTSQRCFPEQAPSPQSASSGARRYFHANLHTSYPTLSSGSNPTLSATTRCYVRDCW